MELLIGADPEVFIRNKKTKQYVAALDIPGTKEKPHALNKGAVQRDGVALEFNIEPASSASEFADNIETVYEQCRSLCPNGHELVAIPAVTFEQSYFDSLPEKIRELGCDRDYNAYTGTVNPIPRTLKPIRTGAGHIHIGWTKNADPHSYAHFYDCQTMVRYLDSYWGQFYPYWDQDYVRQGLYGAQGAFRPKSYGLEYRVPSNAWLNHKEVWPWLFESITWTFNKGLEGIKYDGYNHRWNGPTLPRLTNGTR